MIHYLFYILLSTLYACNALADGFGGVASDINQPVSLIIQLVRGVSIVCGVGLIMGSVLKYIEYKRSQSEIRMSTLIFMLLFGVALIIVGFLPMNAKG